MPALKKMAGFQDFLEDSKVDVINKELTVVGNVQQ